MEDFFKNYGTENYTYKNGNGENENREARAIEILQRKIAEVNAEMDKLYAKKWALEGALSEIENLDSDEG